jgi:chromosomal replication initiator protein
MTQAEKLWTMCLATLRSQVPEPAYNAWLAPLQLSADDATFTVSAPSSIAAELVQTRFLGMNLQALSEVTGTATPILEVAVRPTEDLPADEQENAMGPHEGTVVPFPAADLVWGRDGNEPEGQPDGATGAASDPGSRTHKPATGRGGRSSRNDRRAPSSLIPRYTFATFVIGASNRFANAAAQRVAEEPARAYNPLFIYGASGLGKTHILHAIGHYVQENFPSLNVCYVSTETFLNEFIEAIRSQGQAAFKRRYRSSDVLLVDDIQLLTGKRETQEEFFHTFNSFYDAQKQIVISSDRHPRAIATLEDRLRSRFESGLITDIQPPELETRVAILRKKLEGEKIEVPQDVLELIAACIKDNIRELEGALIRVTAFASIHDVPVTMELVNEVLTDLIEDSAPRQATPKEILDATAAAFDFTVEEIIGPSRRRPLVQARQIAMYLLRVLANYSYPAVAAEMGNRDHTTVMHACKKIEAQMSAKRQVYEQVDELIRKIRTSG